MNKIERRLIECEIQDLSVLDTAIICAHYLSKSLKNAARKMIHRDKYTKPSAAVGPKGSPLPYRHYKHNGDWFMSKDDST